MKNILALHKNKTLSLQLNEKIYVNDNDITKLQIELPMAVNEFPIAECTIELRAVFPHLNEYISYDINTSKSKNEFLISNELTTEPQIIHLVMIIRHEEVVIGQTNIVKIEILSSGIGEKEATPRADWEETVQKLEETIDNKDAEISHLNRDIEYLDQTISEQRTEIEAKDGQISDLNGQVTELTSENTRLESLTDTQLDTIQYMIDNPPSLEYPETPIIPTEEIQTINPTPPYYGIGRIQIDKVLPQPSGTIEITKNGQYDVKQYANANVNIQDEAVLKLIEGTANSISIPYGTQIIRNHCFSNYSNLEEVIIPKTVTFIGQAAFNRTSLRNIEIPSSVKTIEVNAFLYTPFLSVKLNTGIETIGEDAFYECSSLKTINLPNTLTTLAPIFRGCVALENVTIESGFNANKLNLSYSILYSVETIVSWLEALADRTGETAYTLTIGTTNINKLTAEQRAIATNKNWNLA